MTKPKPIPLPMGPLGEMTHMMVRHDDDCPIINGGEDCRCDPIIETLTHEEYLLEVGAIKVH